MRRPGHPAVTLRPEIAQKLIDVYGDIGREWVAGIPSLLARLREAWDIAEVDETFPYLGYAWVAPVRLRDGTEAVLKLAPPDKEFANELEALRLYGGRGAARLLQGDPSAVALLLERLRPGDSVAELDDDVQATEIGAKAMAALFRPLPERHTFPTVERWGAAFARVRDRFGGGCGSFPVELFEPAERIYFEMCASQETPVLLHGDLHHWNILRAEREAWLVIDPKGLAGEPAYETASFLRNKADIEENTTSLAQRRIAQMAEVMGLDRQRILLWAFSSGVLSALWTFEDHGEISEQNIVLPRALSPLL